MSRSPLLTVRGAALIVASVAVAVSALAGTALARTEPAPSEPTEPSGQADAAPPRVQLCNADVLCVWPQPDFMGEVTEILEGTKSACYELPNSARSVVNDTGSSADFFEAAQCQGTPVTGVGPGAKAPSFLKTLSVRLKPKSPAARSRSGGSTGSGSGDSSTSANPDKPTSDKSGSGGSSRSGSTDPAP